MRDVFAAIDIDDPSQRWQLSFRIARSLKRLGPLPPHGRLRAILIDAGLEHVDPLADVDDLALEIEAAWSRVRSTETALAHAVRAAAAAPVAVDENTNLNQLVSIAVHLQRQAGAAVIYLPQQALATAVGCSQRQMSTYIAVACARGWLECVDTHYAPGRRAKCYRVRLTDEGTS